MRPRHRIAVIGVLVVLLLGLGVVYGVNYPANWPYPAEEALVQHSDEFADHEVLLIAEVVDMADDDLVLELEDTVADETREIVVRGVGVVDVEVGGVIQVHGRLGADGDAVVEVYEVVVVERGVTERALKWGLSLLGLLLAAGFFLRHWRIDWRRFGFERRGDHHG